MSCLLPLLPGVQLTGSVSSPADLWSTVWAELGGRPSVFPGHSSLFFDLEVPLKHKASSLITPSITIGFGRVPIYSGKERKPLLEGLSGEKKRSKQLHVLFTSMEEG